MVRRIIIFVGIFVAAFLVSLVVLVGFFHLEYLPLTLFLACLPAFFYLRYSEPTQP